MLPNAFDVAGRVALVAGAGSPDGIGFATARLLGELGASVALTATTDRAYDRAAELRGHGFDALGVVAGLTLTVEEEVRRCVRIVADGLGVVTVLDTTPAAWHASLARNLDTAFLTTRAVLPGTTRPRPRSTTGRTRGHVPPEPVLARPGPHGGDRRAAAGRRGGGPCRRGTGAPRLQLEQLPVVARHVFEVLPVEATIERAALVDTSTRAVHPLPHLV